MGERGSRPVLVDGEDGAQSRWLSAPAATNCRRAGESCCRAGGAEEAGASRAARGRAVGVLSRSGSSEEEGCGRWGAVVLLD